MASARRPLHVRDVGRLLERSERARDAILVGGQALNIWAVRLGLEAEMAVVSDDIDFFANRADAIAAGRDWDAAVVVPGPDDHTPNAALVTVEIDDQAHGIDFMSSIAGVDSDELRRWSSTVEGRGFEFRVMHPLHVLQSQMENVYGSLRRREEKGGEYYVWRVSLAVRVVAAAIGLLLAGGRVREALRAAERVGEIAQKRPAHEALRRDALDLLSAIPGHSAWPLDFTSRRLPQIQERVNSRRKRYLARKQQKK